MVGILGWGGEGDDGDDGGEGDEGGGALEEEEGLPFLFLLLSLSLFLSLFLPDTLLTKSMIYPKTTVCSKHSTAVEAPGTVVLYVILQISTESHQISQQQS